MFPTFYVNKGGHCLGTGELRMGMGMPGYQGEEWCLQHEPLEEKLKAQLLMLRTGQEAGAQIAWTMAMHSVQGAHLTLALGPAVYHCIAAVICFHRLPLLMTWQHEWSSATARFLLMEDWLQGAHCLYQTSAAKHFKFLLLGSSLFPDVSLFLGLRLVTFPNLFFSRFFFVSRNLWFT